MSFNNWPQSSAEWIESLFDFYQGRKVVVTGGGSFIGSRLVDALLEMDCFVTVMDDFSSGKKSNLQLQNPKLQFVEIDLANKSGAAAHFSNQDLVFHLAAVHVGGVSSKSSRRRLWRIWFWTTMFLSCRWLTMFKELFTPPALARTRFICRKMQKVY